jgi:hypothetical protein
MTGLCGLCQQIEELQESHLLPRAAYKHVRGLLAGLKGIPSPSRQRAHESPPHR